MRQVAQRVPSGRPRDTENPMRTAIETVLSLVLVLAIWFAVALFGDWLAGCV